LKIHGQVAQSVERGPEKAGVGGSIPSLATFFKAKVKGKSREELLSHFCLFTFTFFRVMFN
jgi:hypothetical protein